MTVLKVSDLRTIVAGRRPVVAVDGVSFSVERGQIVGIVGESGCGKSMTALSIMGLLPPRAAIAAGSIELGGRELVGLPERDLCRVRGDDVAMIFQDPITSLNPTKRIGPQVAEPLKVHRGASEREARARALEVLDAVRIPAARARYDAYPHELSGGMRQRVMIAIALACGPKVLLADEPTTALDVTVQAQILALLDELRRQLEMAIVLITHDFGVVASLADRVEVMYAGRIVEEASTEALFDSRYHPYTHALLDAIPRLRGERRSRLAGIPGAPPDLAIRVDACRFAPRCPRAQADCVEGEPPLVAARDVGHAYRCIHPLGEAVAGAVAR